MNTTQQIYVKKVDVSQEEAFKIFLVETNQQFGFANTFNTATEVEKQAWFSLWYYARYQKHLVNPQLLPKTHIAKATKFNATLEAKAVVSVMASVKAKQVKAKNKKEHNELIGKKVAAPIAMPTTIKKKSIAKRIVIVDNEL